MARATLEREGKERTRPVALVVDDDEGLRESLRLVLDADFDVTTVSDGLRALELIRSRHVDVILLDILMAGVDGLEVLRAIRAIDDRIPVIMLTAVKAVRPAVDAMKLGAFEYLTKPFEEGELLDLARRAARRRRAELESGAAGAAARRERSGPRILIVGGDLGWRAGLAVLLDHLGRVGMTETALLPTGSLAVGCVVAGDASPAVVRSVEAFRARHPGCPVLMVVGAGGFEAPAAASELDVRWLSRTPGYLGELVELVRASVASAAAGPRLGPHSSRAVEHLCANYGRGLTVTAVAAAVGVSRSHLAHGFRAETGMPLKRFLTRLRVAVAEHLLATTDEKVAGIATRVGFFDGSHLARALRRFAGRRPAGRRGGDTDGVHEI
jgi:DNA-binding response OmpR family regulator/AraC-like DNA-binding protein